MCGTTAARAAITASLDLIPRRGEVLSSLPTSARISTTSGLHMVDDRFPLTVMKEHKEVVINPAILDAYVGVYELAPNFQVAVTREGNSLFAQATAQPKFQLYPESDIEFFLKVVDASFIFVRGATGGVDQIILHQGGASIPGKRVK